MKSWIAIAGVTALVASAILWSFLALQDNNAARDEAEVQGPVVLWEQRGRSIQFWHDDVVGLSCWIYEGGGGLSSGMSCIRDNRISRHRR